jgi:hypothetical protein
LAVNDQVKIVRNIHGAADFYQRAAFRRVENLTGNSGGASQTSHNDKLPATPHPISRRSTSIGICFIRSHFDLRLRVGLLNNCVLQLANVTLQS